MVLMCVRVRAIIGLGWSQAAHKVGVELSHSEVADLFAIVDSNASGQVSYKEFKKWLDTQSRLGQSVHEAHSHGGLAHTAACARHNDGWYMHMRMVCCVAMLLLIGDFRRPHGRRAATSLTPTPGIVRKGHGTDNIV